MGWPPDTDDFLDIWPLAVEASGTGIWDRDVQAGEMRYSASWFRMLGYEDAPQSNPIDVAYARVHPDDLDYVKAAIQAHFDGETQHYEVEHRLRCKNGKYIWVLSRGQVVSRDADGKALRMTGTTTDITNTHSVKARRGGNRAGITRLIRKNSTTPRRKLYAVDEIKPVLQHRATSMPCFAQGTEILTPRGPIAVEMLKIGDAVFTVREGAPSERNIVWVGKRRFGTNTNVLPEQLCPILILADAFGPTLPERDLRLSPDHAVFTADHLIEVRHLINGRTVLRDTTCRSITYHHIALEVHDILLAENLPVESYLECGGKASFINGSTAEEPVILRPDAIKTIDAYGCAPLAGPGSPALRKTQKLLETQIRRQSYKPAE